MTGLFCVYVLCVCVIVNMYTVFHKKDTFLFFFHNLLK